MVSVRTLNESKGRDRPEPKDRTHWGQLGKDTVGKKPAIRFVPLTHTKHEHTIEPGIYHTPQRESNPAASFQFN